MTAAIPEHPFSPARTSTVGSGPVHAAIPLPPVADAAPLHPVADAAPLHPVADAAPLHPVADAAPLPPVAESGQSFVLALIHASRPALVFSSAPAHDP